ncbi:helix-turn-helix domain-containing protein [Streptomyces caniscabiei]|uniref:Helix-turn-helix domain-containing protein n=1 Tax=Streptomyces caniscabiei TaxID=2746961 RepID=A0A927KX15_9ACTN|nr:helix-turn-helix domain-containing protein [Streptomyces caniscabiei]MBD9721921.1 helix-turn-helix domain-containing protein [Streptomyces caniscabiei]MDX3509112.1 helix-turn-helix domain-containing protein [Streptomyces caniscabiei]MDX3717135.1 helix-turn-helix domain-containing protein [Streptomyces caniscabiei]WEO23002.1 helix-turn-helix domain-containing protein [Streptomyces caniscabiei]
MKIRSDVTELLRQGFNNAEIAEETGLHKRTIAQARHRLGIPNATRRRRPTRLERLYLEAVPTGRVKDWKPPAGRMPLSPDQQRANRERLLAALRDPAA